MVTHIVMWKLSADVNKEDAFLGIKSRLEALVGVVPGLLSAQVGKNFGNGEFDVALCSTLESKKALEIYQGHPAHLEVKKYVHSVVCGRQCVDFEV